MKVDIIKRNKQNKTYQYALLRESYREDGKVKNRTLANLSMLPEKTLQDLKLSLKNKTLIPKDEVFKVIDSKLHGHVAAVLGTLRRLNLETIIDPQPSRERDLVTAMIVQRIIHPCSKLATARLLDRETCPTSLNSVLNLDEVEEDELYAALDWLLKRQDSIEKKLSRRHLRKGSLVLFDLTATYYEGKVSDLIQHGDGKDKKKGKPQIVFGLLCTREGIPVSVQVYKGNTSDCRTLGDQLEKIRDKFNLSKVVVVGDRGVITQKLIDKELSDHPGVSWITALRAPTIRKMIRQDAFQMSLFDHQNLGEIEWDEYPNERFIVCRNPFLAEERSIKRKKLLEATEKELSKIQQATERKCRPLQGAIKIGLKVGEVVNKHKMKKHFILTVKKKHFSYHRDEAKIHEEQLLDGIYVLRTNVSNDLMEKESVVKAYKDLSHVETAFRVMKQILLKVRPIYHRLTKRIKSHIFLCMLAYYVQWHMMHALSPLLFCEDDPSEAAQLRASVIHPAEQSHSLKSKKSLKRTKDDYPVHSFDTLLESLETVVQNTVLFGEHPTPMLVYTENSRLHERVFELLQVNPVKCSHKKN